MKKFLAVLLSLAMVAGVLAGCASSSEEGSDSSAASSDGSSSEGIQIDKDDLKVALVLPGNINDQGWCTTAYMGLQEIEEDYGCETNYMENVDQSSYEEAFRNYASSGYNVIFGHGAEFFDAAATVGEEYPDVAFIVTSTDQSSAPNVASVNTLPKQMGVLAGIAMAHATKTGTVGVIGGYSLVSIVGACNACTAAALMTNPDLKVLTNMTGSDEDSAKAKEVAQSMIDQGADVIFYDADAAGLGALEACEENGIMAIPAIADGSSLAPDTVLMSACNDIPKAMDTVVKYIIDGSFKGQFYPMGCDTDCVFYVTNAQVWDTAMDDEGKAAVEDAFQQMKSGDMDADEIIDEYLPSDLELS